VTRRHIGTLAFGKSNIAQLRFLALRDDGFVFLPSHLIRVLQFNHQVTVNHPRSWVTAQIPRTVRHESTQDVGTPALICDLHNLEV